MIENFGDKTNTNGFDKNPNNINKSGRPFSFKRTYKEILEGSDSVIWVDAKNVVRRNINMEGGTVEQIGITFSPVEKLLLRLNELASSSNDRTAFNAIKFIWEQMDGKPKQSVQVKENKSVRIGYGPDPEGEEE